MVSDAFHCVMLFFPFFLEELLMEWRCKLCSASVESSQGALLKHYRVNHGTYSRGYTLPCPYIDCPCTFKTWGGLRTHLNRFHVTKDTEVGHCFRCKICNSFHSNTKDYFHHINSHLKRNETIECVLDGCNFTTNIYGTYATHKSRNHRGQHSVKAFKPELIATPPIRNENEMNE